MKKKIYSNLILMMCAVFLFAGCAANGNTGETQQEVQETEHKSEVRSAFVEEKVTETTEPEEALQPEDDTSATADGRGELNTRRSLQPKQYQKPRQRRKPRLKSTASKRLLLPIKRLITLHWAIQ